MYTEHSFRNFLEHAPDGIVIINAKGEIVYVNKQIEVLFQYTREELLGQLVEKLIPKEFHKKHVVRRQMYMEKPQIRPLSHPGHNLIGIKKNGKEFKVEISLSPVETGKGELLIFSSVRDISDRILMEEKLLETQGMFEKIFDSSLHGIIKLKSLRNESGEIIDFIYQLINKQSEAHIRRSRNEIIGKRILEEFPHLKEAGAFDAFVETVESGNSSFIEYTYDFEDSKAWFRSNIVKEGDGVIVSFDDITSRKEHQKKIEELNIELEKRVKERTKELSQANEKLINVNHKLDKYAYLISHDLKAPLANIEGLAGFLKADYENKPLDEEAQMMLGMMEVKVRDMREIIETLLQSAKDEIGNKELVDLYQEAQKAIQVLDPPSHFHMFVQHNLPVVKYQKGSISQIFQNLIGNSIKYMDKDSPLITISSKENDDKYVICVTDNGSGIPEDMLTNVFTLFETAHNSDVQDSHGIGLSIVKQLVEQNGGKIWAESNLGQETKFHFTIPKS